MTAKTPLAEKVSSLLTARKSSRQDNSSREQKIRKALEVAEKYKYVKVQQPVVIPRERFFPEELRLRMFDTSDAVPYWLQRKYR